MTRSDDVINEDGHDVIAAHTRVVRGMAAALAAIAATGAGVTAAAANVMFTFALDTKAKRSMFNMPHEETPKGIEFDMSEQLEAARWFEEAKQSVTLRSHDGLKLHGWLLDPDCSDPQPHLYAICCHGYAGEPAEMAKWAHRYAQLGFTVLLPAQRAHELSEGRYVGMGLLESDDLLGWVSLITAADPDARILLHGNSMGAATVMMAAGDARLPRNVVAAISDCGYSSVVSQFTDNAEAMFRLPHSLAVVVEEIVPRPDRPADKPMSDVRVNVFVERDSQKAIIIGRGGSRLREVGTNARAGIERLLGHRVHLDLHVKVAKDWQRDPKQLQRLGF